MKPVAGSSTVIVLHSEIDSRASEDEQDTLVQVRSVMEALDQLGVRSKPAVFSIDIASSIHNLRQCAPCLVFNLVESMEGSGKLIHVAPSFLDYLGIPYTGCPSDALLTTSNKIATKRLLFRMEIDTPPWQECCDAVRNGLTFLSPGILKSVWEHASIGMSDRSVFPDTGHFLDLVRSIDAADHSGLFAEQYIAGREFNIALLQEDTGPRVLPPAEMHFRDYPADKPAIVGYRAKWDRDSFEYSHTVRSFDFAPHDEPLLEQLRRISLECWNAFGLRGYARVDFRVDDQGKPWVLEINANPCISPDSGFVAAASRAGLSYPDIISRIVQSTPGVFPI